MAGAEPDVVRAQLRTPLPSDARWVRPAALGPGQISLSRPDSLLVLSYHNVTADGSQPGDHGADHYTVAAAEFAAQMEMLRELGYASVRLADLLDWRSRGVAPRPRSVLITFDDGGSGQWIYADRILAEVGFTAAAFLITGHLGANPNYLHWAEAKALARTGRWDIGAHTHDHHHFVPTGPGSPRASILINRVWDPATGRLQPLEAARASFDDDLATSLELLGRAGLGSQIAFAYPFSQVDDPTNDPAFATYVRGQLAGRFPLLFTNAVPDRTARPEDLRAGLVPRVEVRHGTSALKLFEDIRAADMPGWQGPGRAVPVLPLGG